MTIDEMLSKSAYAPVAVNPEIVPEDGVVFLYVSWSPGFANLIPLLNCLDTARLNLPLIIYDIDEPAFPAFADRYGLTSHGKGEMYFLKKGAVSARLTEFATQERIDAFVQEICNLTAMPGSRTAKS